LERNLERARNEVFLFGSNVEFEYHTIANTTSWWARWHISRMCVYCDIKELFI